MFFQGGFMICDYTSVFLKDLKPHPKISRILTRSRASFEHENYSFLTDEMLLLMQKSTPLHVVETDKNQLLFFAGWQFINEFQQREIKKIVAVIHKKEPDQIVLWALQNELGNASFIRGDIEKKQQAYYDLLDDNKSLWSRIFTAPTPKTTVSALQKLCNLTRGSARKFNKKEPQKDGQENPLACLLEKLKQKAADDDQ